MWTILKPLIHIEKNVLSDLNLFFIPLPLNKASCRKLKITYDNTNPHNDGAIAYILLYQNYSPVSEEMQISVYMT